MTSSVSWVQTGDGAVLDWVHTEEPVWVTDPPDLPDPLSLDSLTDVAGASVAPAGRVLIKNEDGQWRPGVGGGGGGSADTHRHDQLVAAAVWTINHGLGRYPSSVSLHSAGFVSDYDEFVIQHLDVNTLRVSMDTPVAGVALVI